MQFEIKNTNKATDSDIIESLTVEFTFNDDTTETVNVGVQTIALTPESVTAYLNTVGNAMQSERDKAAAIVSQANSLVGLTSTNETPVIGA
jgi:hypothetical protein